MFTNVSNSSVLNKTLINDSQSFPNYMSQNTGFYVNTSSQKIENSFGRLSGKSKEIASNQSSHKSFIPFLPDDIFQDQGREQRVGFGNLGHKFGNFRNWNFPNNYSSMESSMFDQPTRDTNTSSFQIPENSSIEEPKKINEACLATPGDIMDTVKQNQINCINLLNEVSSKTKKKVTYKDKEIFQCKMKLYETICTFNGQLDSYGRGNSKKTSKYEAATAMIRLLVTRSDYECERAHIVLSLRNIIENALQLSNSHDSVGSKTENKDSREKSEEELQNDFAVYTLNLIAKECFIKTKWEISSAAGPNGHFEVKLFFDELVATGKGRRKVDAKRNASLDIIRQIRASKKLSEKYDYKARKQKSNENITPHTLKKDPAKRFFESCLNPKLLNTLEEENRVWRESITKLNRSLDEHLESVLLQYKLDDEDSMDLLQQVFKRVADYTNMITSNPKQVLLDAPRHLADYVTDCSLIPIGSFALGCMRFSQECKVIDTLLVYREKKSIPENTLLELYKESLIETQELAIKANPQIDFRIKVSIEDSDLLCIETNTTKGTVKTRVLVCNLSQNGDGASKYDASVLHIKRIYDCFEETKDLKRFRDLMCLIRLWRMNNGLLFLPAELLDVVLLHEFLKNKNENISGYIINCLRIMGSLEIFPLVLSKYGDTYTSQFKQIPRKFIISAKCEQSLEAIYQGDFTKCLFC